MTNPEVIEAWVFQACLWEVTARKVGNVHPKQSFADTTFTDFAISAWAAASAFRQTLTTPTCTVGRLVLNAITHTRHHVHANTNLGIVLLLAPLGVAEQNHRPVAAILSELSLADARDVYAAIRRAAPGGLGAASEHDVADAPTISLIDAMRLAADRDLIARQYTTNYADVFETALPGLLTGLQQFSCLEAAIIYCHLELLAATPDTLIARKCGAEVAAEILHRSQQVRMRGGLTTPEGRAAARALDAHLRSDGNRCNPGATADLVAATLFIALAAGRIPPRTPFPWITPDWL